MQGKESPPEVLKQSWTAYVRRFIQEDGRVIDHSASGISTSEGQAYAMLRAVWMGDRVIFDKAFNWAQNNLNARIRKDHLWAWKWGKDSSGKWHVLDKAFASDADQDAALALALASKVWQEPKYLQQARAVLTDLWNLGTREVSARRYLLAGDTLCQSDICKLNPSYYAPYAYRIFSSFHNAEWAQLVDSSYFVVENSSRLTSTGLPPDWVSLNTRTGRLSLGSEKDSRFSYDAFRVYWRVALDLELFNDPRAEQYLRRSLAWVAGEWHKRKKLPAVITSSGKPKAEYESLEMLAGLMPAIRSLDPDIAAAMNQKLQSSYARGIWGDSNSYYIQNWAWFGTALFSRYLAPLRQL